VEIDDPVMREQIRAEVEGIEPGDEQESRTKQDVLRWIDSGVELCRRERPATPPRHLVSYFMLVDGDHVMLVDHINAMLWLPTGGHVEPGEHPRMAAVREAKEELGIDAELLRPEPLFITSTFTVGKTAGHTDVSLWYVMRGSREQELEFAASEFHSIRWFHRDRVPLDRSDPEMERFLRKLAALEPRS
jgi:8-oxo-dGTP pyrophosphatase MutT (NUDIX family)